MATPYVTAPTPVFPIVYEVFLELEGYDCLRRAVNLSEAALDTTLRPEEEKQVLGNLYHATGGQRWCNNTGWLDTAVHHCLWYSITCYDGAPYVRAIQLAMKNLNGSLPKDLWKLRNLQALWPNDNPLLVGEFEDIIHPNMAKLVTLLIRRTRYTGRIPDAFTKLVRLQTFLAWLVKSFLVLYRSILETWLSWGLWESVATSLTGASHVV